MQDAIGWRSLLVDNGKKFSPKGSAPPDRHEAGAADRATPPRDGERGERMSKLTGIALKCAQLVPSAMFASPDAVVRSKELSLPQKIAILRRWEFDLCQHGGARKAPAGAAEASLLEEVNIALAALDAPGAEPTGQGSRRSRTGAPQRRTGPGQRSSRVAAP